MLMLCNADIMKQGYKKPLTPCQVELLESELPDVGVALHHMLYLQSMLISTLQDPGAA